jgi:hypothetical protein
MIDEWRKENYVEWSSPDAILCRTTVRNFTLGFEEDKRKSQYVYILFLNRSSNWAPPITNTSKTIRLCMKDFLLLKSKQYRSPCFSTLLLNLYFSVIRRRKSGKLITVIRLLGGMSKSQDSILGKKLYILSCRTSSQALESTQSSLQWVVRDDTAEILRPMHEPDHIFTFLLQLWTPLRAAAFTL